MSEDRFEQDEPKDEDVEAHRKTRSGTDEGTDTPDDVEAHRKTRAANEEPGSDDSDDVEAHARRASHKSL
jgi:hypothetical protein